MKMKDIAVRYGINGKEMDELKSFIWSNDLYKNKLTVGITGDVLADDVVEQVVSEFKCNKEHGAEVAASIKADAERKRIEAEQKRMEEERIRAEQEAIEASIRAAAMAKMLITSGFNFDGYTITKYSGYISGDDAVSIDRGTVGWFGVGGTNVGEELTKALVRIRRKALQELKEAAYDLGCNAVIGVDFDYLTLEPETANAHGGTTYLPYVICVTANGNAVIIEKNKD